MYKLLPLIFFLLVITTTSAQDLNNSTITKTALINYIEQAKQDGKVAENPIVVLDEKLILDVASLKKDQTFYKELRIINKGNKGMVEIYGDKAINGVIMLESLPKNPEGQKSEIPESDIVILLNKKEITKEQLEKIDPNLVQEVHVIKTKEEIAKHTDKTCDAVLLIRLKY